MFNRLSIFLIILLSLSCSKKESQEGMIQDADYQILSKTLNLPKTPYPYSTFDIKPEIKGEFEAIQENIPEDNPITDWGATLGRVLFYDKALSKNKTIACASCHKQSHGFSDPEKLSKGYLGGLTARHSMGLSNARYNYEGRYFWDERALSLEQQVLMPIQDEVEMGMTLPEVFERLKSTLYYPILFKKSFGDEEINSDRLSKALAQFVRSIVSGNSRYDNGLVSAGGDVLKPFENFNHSENKGKMIFYSHDKVLCGGCHNTRVIIGDAPRNNGTHDGDEGVFKYNPHPQYKGAFRVPSLRNIAVRPPYMHNGSLNSLEEVVEHYNSGLENTNGSLDPHLVRAGQAVKMNLSNEEKKALVDFLNTLTDEEFLSNVVYSDPFLK